MFETGSPSIIAGPKLRTQRQAFFGTLLLPTAQQVAVMALVPQPAYGYHTTTAKPQRNTNTHRTRAKQPMK